VLVCVCVCAQFCTQIASLNSVFCFFPPLNVLKGCDWSTLAWPCGGALLLPSVPADSPSGLVMPVLFFLRCFLRLACGDGGGSSLGLVALEEPPPPPPPPPAAAATAAVAVVVVVASPVSLAKRKTNKQTNRKYE